MTTPFIPGLTAVQKIQHMYLLEEVANELVDTSQLAGLTADSFDDTFSAILDDNCLSGLYEFSEGTLATNVPTPSSRHYEAKSVAAQYGDGSWVVWTHWYGGGKHGAPEEIDWLDGAYDLTCVEEEQLVTVRTFTKVETANG